MRHRRLRRTAAALAAAGACAAATAAPAASQLIVDPGALPLAASIAADSDQVTGAAFVSSPPIGGATAVGLGISPLAGFPTHGGSYAVLTTGDVTLAPTANTSGSSGVSLNGGNVRGNSDYDVTVLRISLDVPATANCLTGLDFRFLSDEFPEYVGSAYNDAFIAELDASTWTTAGSTIVAPRNFAFDPEGNPISINAAGVTSMRAEYAAGTTYDGATPILSAATPITPGAHTLYLSIFDQGDQVYDSAVFLDNLRFGRVADVVRDCRPGAVLADNRKFVGLGDSYSSGFGVHPYFPGTSKDGTENDCQRSTLAYAPVVAAALALELVFHACQGAVTRDFYEARAGGAWGELPQLDYLDPETGLVAFSIGGNDAHFADVVRDCIDGWELLPWNTCHGDDRVTKLVADSFARLDNRAAAPAEIVPFDRLLKDVRARTPFATRVQVGYPPLFPAQGGDRTFLPGGRCEGVKKADQRWMVEMGAELNAIIERNALRNGFRFVDPTDAFARHELCGGDDEWFYGIVSSGRFHPTTEGQDAIAQEILAELDRADGPRFVVRSQETVTHSFPVGPGRRRLSVVSEWPGSDVELTLISPSGYAYTRAEPGAGVYHANGPTWEQFEIPDPEPGQWTASLYGADVDPEGEDVTLSIYAEEPPNLPPAGAFTWYWEGGQLRLDGTASDDPDGEVVAWDWYVASEGVDLVVTGAQASVDLPRQPVTVTLVVTDDEGLTDFVTQSAAVLDVLPGSETGPLDPKAQGRLPVALLASAALDVTQIDAGTLRLGPGGASPVPKGVRTEDVNGDGRADLVATFAKEDIGAIGPAILCLTGELPDERPFEACDLTQILFDWSGLLATAADAPAVTTAHSTGVTTFWFRLGGDFGLDVLAAGSPSSRPIDCATFAPLGAAEPATTPAWEAFGYQAHTGRYSFPWKPPSGNAWAGTCRELVIDLADGTSHSAYIRFVK